MVNQYEQIRKQNIEDNRRILAELGILNPFKPLGRVVKKSVKRKRANSGSGEWQPKRQALEEEVVDMKDYGSIRGTRRRSSRILGKDAPSADELKDEVDKFVEDEENSRLKVKANRPKFYGRISDVEVGTVWQTRLEACQAGVHRPTVAGIHGGEDGAYSIALSGGYEDDIDLGECFTYTGEGGRDLKGTKANPKNLRTAAQSKDQTLTRGNLALSRNVETGNPVRVIRGYKLQSPFAPEEGYRYDGIYTVEKAWFTIGLSGFGVWKFALQRSEDQAPPPWNIIENVDANSNITDSGKSNMEEDFIDKENLFKVKEETVDTGLKPETPTGEPTCEAKIVDETKVKTHDDESKDKIHDDEPNAKTPDEESNAKTHDDESNAKIHDDESKDKTPDESNTITPDESHVKSHDDVFNAKTLDEESNAKTHDDESNAKLHDDESNAKTCDDESNAKTLDEESNAKTLDQESNAKTLDQESNAKPCDESNAKTHDDESNAKPCDESNAKTCDEDSNAKNHDDESKAKSDDNETKAQSPEDEIPDVEQKSKTLNVECVTETFDFQPGTKTQSLKVENDTHTDTKVLSSEIKSTSLTDDELMPGGTMLPSQKSDSGIDSDSGLTNDVQEIS